MRDTVNTVVFLMILTLFGFAYNPKAYGEVIGKFLHAIDASHHCPTPSEDQKRDAP